MEPQLKCYVFVMLIISLWKGVCNSTVCRSRKEINEADPPSSYSKHHGEACGFLRPGLGLDKHFIIHSVFKPSNSL